MPEREYDFSVPIPAPSSRWDEQFRRPLLKPPEGAVAGARTSPLYDLPVGANWLFIGRAKSSVASQAYKIGSQIGARFTVKEVANGVRVWRVE